MVTFLTPYWSGSEMMRIHLRALRRFHPTAPILVSKRGGQRDEMDAYRREFGIEYWIEECGYTDAYLRLLQRCTTRLACFIDHDAVLLSSLDRLITGLTEGRYDLVGIEERIRYPESVPVSGSHGWLRFAPGQTASNFLLFDWQAFKSRHGLAGVFGQPMPGARHFDFDYGIGQRLRRHKYLRPFHASRYGIGNLLKDDGADVVWHQWYGSYRTRLGAIDDGGIRAVAEAGEHAFLADYPELAFGDVTPAWGPDLDIDAEQQRLHETLPVPSGRHAQWRRLAGRHWRALKARTVVGFQPR
ncbi:MAG: hypothetical protein RLZZ53_2212 [Acidobacteriota bacterium]|jgi:hypothetical protein